MRENALYNLMPIIFLMLFTNICIAQDTTVIVKECLIETIIKEGNTTTTSTKFLNCFWDSGTDTLVTVENCIQITQISKLGYTFTNTKKLDCFQNDNIVTEISITGDTIITIEDCIKKTTIKKGSSKSSSSEFLDCFWKSGTDTLVTNENCLQITKISKLGYQKTQTKKLNCFWDDAIITGRAYYIYSPKQEKSYFDFRKVYSKNGEMTSSGKKGRLDAYQTRRLGLDKFGSDTIYIDIQLEEEILSAYKRRSIPTIGDTTIQISEALRAVNELRAKGCKCGGKIMPPVPPVKWSNELEIVAFHHAKDMSLRNYFAHTSPEGKSPFNRMDEYGLEYSLAGENIHQGGYDVLEAVYRWEKSPGHCKNMMMESRKYIGVGRFMSKYCMLLSGSLSFSKKRGN